MEYAVPSRAAISATDAPAGACVGCAPAVRVGGERFCGDFVYERGSLAVIVPVQLRRIDVSVELISAPGQHHVVGKLSAC